MADRPYRLQIVQRRLVAGVPRRFVAERRVVFRHESGGWGVDMLLVDVSTDLPGEAGRRFVAAAGALRGVPVRLHLAADGALTGLDEEQRIGAAVGAGLAMVGNAGVAPPPIDRATLADPLGAMIAGAEARRAAGRRPVTVPSLTPGNAPLTGEQTVSVQPDGRLRIVTAAHGAAGPGSVAIERDRLIDPATGLVERQSETRMTRVGDQELQVDSEQTLIPVP